MKAFTLNGTWQMKTSGEAGSIPAQVPGTVAGALLAQGRIDDPYWQDNEGKVLPVFEKDHSFTRGFAVTEELLQHDRVCLCCDGLDTLAEITLNGQPLAETNNMHRRYRFDIKDRLRVGENSIEILFRAPRQPKAGTGMGSFPTGLRKAACMFGWDWGLSLPDSGIWRGIGIEVFDGVRLEHIQIGQKHEPGKVVLHIAPEAEVWGKGISLHTEVLDPEGRVLFSQDGGGAQVEIENPRLWQPIGLGEQPLYTVRLTAQRGGAVLEVMEKRTGLRTVALDRSRQPDGAYDYAFSVNGSPIYIRGQALVIEDAFLGRSTPARWQRLVDNAVRSNLNCIRVWGGAYYPPELFFELCDQAGILVYMDFMFACSQYPADDAFCENVRIEAEQQVKMMASHPCLLILCGNNEIELAEYCMNDLDDPIVQSLLKLFMPDGGASIAQTPPEILAQARQNYNRLFRKLLKEASGRYAPEIPYVSSSPSLPEGVTGGVSDLFANGDMHYYLQYDGSKPYRHMAELPARFLSEVGFQSYPSIKTIQAFCGADSQKPDSPVMHAHQKCKNGNETIEEYMGRDYKVPEDFSHYVYLSQLLAAEIMKFTAETYRRQSGFNRGTIIWQYNDCWPVVSWSGVDYYGRWKALQYYIKRFFAPVLLSAKIEGDTAELWLNNDSRAPFTGKACWRLCGHYGAVLRSGQATVTALSGQGVSACRLDFAEELKNGGREGLHLEYSLFTEDGGEMSQETALFCLPREFQFAQPSLKLDVRDAGERYEVTVASDAYAKTVMLDTSQGDCLFSDNWFDLPAGKAKRVHILKKDTDISCVEDLRRNLTAMALNQVC